MDNNKSFSLTLSQEDIYFDQLKKPLNPCYNVGGYILINSSLNVRKLQLANRELVQKHDVFGIRIVETSQGPRQYIDDSRTLDLPLKDFSNIKNPVREADKWLKELFENAINVEG